MRHEGDDTSQTSRYDSHHSDRGQSIGLPGEQRPSPSDLPVVAGAMPSFNAPKSPPLQLRVLIDRPFFG
jgi:hypothetical protein